MTPEEADSFVDLASAYVHIPFCSAVCPYCDFAVVAGRDELTERYVGCLVEEIDRSEPWRPLGAVYFGGGTPSHLSPPLLGRILDALDRRHGIAGDAELTLEANPEDFDQDRAAALVALGYNRVSFGAQSFDDRVLLALGRRHGARHIEDAIRAAREAGFENLSLDLIYGTPVESASSWSGSVTRALALRPDHVSAYALTVEPGTPLARDVRSGAPSPDPDAQADRYEEAAARLAGAGLARYEVSNWSVPGHECRYNLTVWAQGEYEAYGNGAHGYRNSRRYRNFRRLDSYLEAVEEGRSAVAGEEPVEGWDAEIDRIFVGLRRTTGVSWGPGVDAFASSERGRRLIEAGVVELDGMRMTVAQPLMTDEVHRAVLGLAPVAQVAQTHPGDNVSGRQHA